MSLRPLFLAVLLSFSLSGSAVATDFIRGDCDADSGVNIADVVFLLGNLFPSGPPNVITCEAACDGNDDDAVNIADAVGILGSIFGSPTMPLPMPNSQCGPDQTPGVLSCLSSPCPLSEVFIPGGTFLMGDHTGAVASLEYLVHQVTLDPFIMGTYEVTIQEYCDFLNSASLLGNIEVVAGGVVKRAGDSEEYCRLCDHCVPIAYQYVGGWVFWVEPVLDFFGQTMVVDDHPMVWVSWYGAAAYLNWRSAQEGLLPCYDMDSASWDCDFSASGYRLPTEAEWEYAARGGQYPPYTLYPWGNNIDGSNANYLDSWDPYELGNLLYAKTTPVGYYDGGQTPVGVDMANGYGLYDMSGNAFEWCNDWYEFSYYSHSPSLNPTGPWSGNTRVMRGGGSDSEAIELRLAYRFRHVPSLSNLILTTGFRSARAVP